MTKTGIITALCCALHFAAGAQDMALEADSFLAGLPLGLQAAQEHAVRQAMSGDNTLLQGVRAARNNATPLPEGVNAIDIDNKYRLYRPGDTDGTFLPVLIYLHGGGWCFGSINSCSNFCASLALNSGVAVLAADYPLAPENPYPAALDSCVDAVRFTIENADRYDLDSNAISVGGDSAGGNLALATALKLAQEADSIHFIKSLVLFYPVVKAWPDGSPSWLEYGTGYGLDSGIMDAFNKAYTGSASPTEALVSPYCADKASLALLPPPLIVNAGRDILCSQGEDMHKRLQEAGVESRREVFEGAVHLFITVPGQPSAFNKAVKLAGEFLRQ